ncbi:hypothetical protein FVE85_3199 [Porphyridium purpureum]|uniref:Uncharacterized protein n=1 Tax=Porphyridium purpureum TaxID=35688 RepID=A0A5J4YUS9_PORPP|nr:hypothetical protein FVE85_3199 [Porphyridium purpureum]|eukprot:POR6866..scf227_4
MALADSQHRHPCVQFVDAGCSVRIWKVAQGGAVHSCDAARPASHRCRHSIPRYHLPASHIRQRRPCGRKCPAIQRGGAVIRAAARDAHARGASQKKHTQSPQSRRKILLVLETAAQEELLLGARVLAWPADVESIGLNRLSTVEIETWMEVRNLEELKRLPQSFESYSSILLLGRPVRAATRGYYRMLGAMEQHIPAILERMNAVLICPEPASKGREDEPPLLALKLSKFGSFYATAALSKSEGAVKRMQMLLGASSMFASSAMLLSLLPLETHDDARSFCNLFDTWVHGLDTGVSREAWLESLIAMEVAQEDRHLQASGDFFTQEELLDLGVLQSAIERFNKAYGLSPEDFPGMMLLKREKRDDIIQAIRVSHGGVARVRRILKLKRTVTRRGRLVTVNERSLAADQGQIGDSGRAKHDLQSDQNADANRGIALSPPEKSKGLDAETLAQELREFTRQQRLDKDVMPNEHELRAAGRGDLCYAVRLFGGYRIASKVLGLRLKRRGAMRRYADFEVFESDLRAFMREVGIEILPTISQIKSAGRTDLLNGIKAYGGLHELGRRLDLSLSYQAARSRRQEDEDMGGVGRGRNHRLVDYKGQ